MRRFESASPEIPLSSPWHPFSLLENSRDVLLSMAPLMAGSLFILLLLLFLLLLFFLLVCRPWRFFVRNSRSIETHDITRPLISENLDVFSGQNNGLARSIGEQRQVIQIDDNGSSIGNHSFVSRKRGYSLDPAIIQEESTLLDYENDAHDVGNTLKRTAVTSWCTPDSKHLKQHEFSTLTLKVTSGPSSGLCMSITSTFSPAILTIGRVPPSSLILNDSEVSGKHAVVKFNKETQKWEITDLGSLNGTYLNSIAIHHPDVGSRNHGSANALSSGDVITFGTASNVSVNIEQNNLANSLSGRVGGKALNEILSNLNLPSPGIGMASDPMARRRGGKALPMEDVSLSQYPLPGVEKFGLVGVFDGHGGSGAAETASK
jgi:protein phosphatase